MKLHRSLAAISLAASLLAPGWVQAGEDHDHGDTAANATSTVLPRFTAVSETFELVGILKGKQITLYLDRVSDNSPVTDAQIELEIADTKLKAEKHGTDEYDVMLADELKPGVFPVTAAVVVGQESDLLAGEFDIHEEDHDDEHTHSWKEYAAWSGGGALIALIVATLVGWRLRAGRTI